MFLFCLFLCLVWSYFKVVGLGWVGFCSVCFCFQCGVILRWWVWGVIGMCVLFCLFLFLVWSYFKVVGLGCMCVFVLFVFVFSVELF